VPTLAEAAQTTLQDGVPLSEVTFCVVDLETTGGSPSDSRITEIGAVKVRAGECLGELQTLVDPGLPIPPFITHLTGIDDTAVSGAPRIAEVLPTFDEFASGCVFVAHNARFDFTFVNSELLANGYPKLPGPPVCTARLARRVVWPDVPNVRLHTLAQYFRTSVRPTHRALSDARACAEVLRGLLELGARLGILTLGDLYLAVTARGRPNYGKIRLADALPSAPGVYLFRGRDGRVLYVGKSKNLRTRVKSYFYGDGRKQVDDLLAETHGVEGVVCGSELEALVVEARMIRAHEPKYNRRGKTWRRYAFLRIDTAEAYPRIKVVREPKGPGTYLGPFASGAQARLAKEALEEVFPIRRCTASMRAATRFAPCALADIGRCAAPCDDRTDPERYGELVRGLLSSLSTPAGLLGALEERMDQLAAQERFEEAALARDRIRALAEALRRERMHRWLLAAGELRLRDPAGAPLRLVGGTLVRDDHDDPIGHPPPRERADELGAVRSWLATSPVALERAERPPSEPVEGGARLHAILSRLRSARGDRAEGTDREAPSSPSRGRRQRAAR
jgi:DNA polymerase-3 subunit epsilon